MISNFCCILVFDTSWEQTMTTFAVIAGLFPLLATITTPVPEPSSLVLVGGGVAALILLARRRRKQQGR